MSTPSAPPDTERMYSKLVDDEDSAHDFSRGPQVGDSANAFRLPTRLSGAGPYRLTIACLATLCAVLLISVIAVAAHHKSTPQNGNEKNSELQKQLQDANLTALTATIKKLHQEKDQLQKEKEQLLLKLAATKAPAPLKPTTRPAPAPITCPINWNRFGSSCYFISTISKDWESSQSFCEMYGAHLAIIHTAEEQTFLWNLLPRGHWNAYWFGITDEHTEDQWKWVDGTPLVGGFWEVGEPNNHIDEDCGYIVKTRVMERVAIRSWYDAPCSMYRNFICEKEMNTSTSITTAH